MGGCKCSYRNCKATTLSLPNIHFFHFPVKDRKRCEQWIINAQKPYSSSITSGGLQNKVICQSHFEDWCFMNEKHNRLVHNAVPTIDTNAIVNIDENITLVPSASEFDDDSNGFTLLVGDSSTVLNSSIPHSPLNIDCNEPESLSLVPIDPTTFRISNSSPSSPPPTKVLKLNVKSIIPNLTKPTVNTSKSIETNQFMPTKSKQTYILSEKGDINLVESDEETNENLNLSMEDIEISESNCGDSSTYSVCSSQPEQREEYTNPNKKMNVNIIKNEAAHISLKKQIIASPKITNNRKRIIFKYISKNISPVLAAALRMELFKNSTWTEIEKQMCIELYTSTKEGYATLVEKWGLKLPHTDLIETWISERD